MLVRLTSQNQVTLPGSMASAFEGTEYFEAAIEDGRLALTPARLTGADAVRFKLDDLGLSEADVGEAVSWARRRQMR